MRKIINYAKEADTLNNIVYIPDRENAEASELPLLVFLHGAGERGENISHVERGALPELIDYIGKHNPAVVLCPQCPGDVVWDNIPEIIKKTIDITVYEYDIKPDRIVLTGASMGGFGAVMMGMTYRNFFAGIVSVSGGGMSWRSHNLATTPMLFYHGDKDEAVPVEYSLMLYNELKKNNIAAEIKILPGLDHGDGIKEAYKDPYLINWILSRRRKKFNHIPEFLEEMF